MRVISKFRDYYDNTGYHDDEPRVWVRERQEHHVVPVPNKFQLVDRPMTNWFDINTNKVLSEALHDLPRIRERGSRFYGNVDMPDFMIVLGFCGRLYPIIIHVRDNKVHSSYSDIDVYLEMILEHYKGKMILSHSSSWHSDASFTAKYINVWKERFNDLINVQEVFVDLKTPVFILQNVNMVGVTGDVNLIINPCMKDYNLMSQFHPFHAHQEIDMYLGNDLAMCNLKDFKMSDELKRDSKGMDEWSFKQKGPKNRKRK